MKKTKRLVPLLAVAGFGTTIAPLFTITGCSCSCSCGTTTSGEVTKNDWQAAFVAIDFKNHRNLNYTISGVTEGGAQNITKINHTGKVVGSKIYEKDEEEEGETTERYCEYKENTLFSIRKDKDEQDKYYYSLDTLAPFDYIDTIISHKLEYDQFTYNGDGVYVHKQMAELKIKFSNKKIVRYEGVQCYFDFKDYGSSEIKNFPIPQESTWKKGTVDTSTGSCTITSFSYNREVVEYILEFDIKDIGGKLPMFTFTKGANKILKDDIDEHDYCFIATNSDGMLYSNASAEGCTWVDNTLQIKTIESGATTIYMSFSLLESADDVKVMLKTSAA